MAVITPESPTNTEPPEGLEEYPAYSEAVLDYEAELERYLKELDELTVAEPPEGFVDTHDGVEPIDAASPHMAVAVFLLRHGAPVALTKEGLTSEDDGDERATGISIWISPEIEGGYKELWHKIFHEPARQLANSMARGMVGLDEAVATNFHVAPVVNRDILWADSQGILQRAFVTSMLNKYEGHGTDPKELGTVGPSEAKVVETLISEYKPLALESVLGMGIGDAISALQDNPALAASLRLDNSELPTVDSSRLGLNSEQFEAAYNSYWSHLLN